MGRLLKWMKGEFRRIFPAVLYFFIAFNLINLTFGWMLVSKGIPRVNFIGTVIWASVVGKIMLVVDHLPILNIFSKKPLIYNTLWKSVIYSIVCYIIRLAHHLMPLSRKYNSIVIGFQHLQEDVWWPMFWTIQIWFFLLFFLFVAARELSEYIGEAKMGEIFFGKSR